MRIVDAGAPWLGLAASTDLAEFRRAFAPSVLCTAAANRTHRTCFRILSMPQTICCSSVMEARASARPRCWARSWAAVIFLAKADRRLRATARNRLEPLSRTPGAPGLARPDRGQGQSAAEPSTARQSRGSSRCRTANFLPPATGGRLISPDRRQRTFVKSKLNTNPGDSSRRVGRAVPSSVPRVTEPGSPRGFKPFPRALPGAFSQGMRER